MVVIDAFSAEKCHFTPCIAVFISAEKINFFTRGDRGVQTSEGEVIEALGMPRSVIGHQMVR